MIQYQVNINETGRDYPHYWELCVGSCHAATILREDVRQQIRKAHADIGFQYLRFHGLFDDDMSVVIDSMIPGMGPRQISFFNIDRVFDFLLETGMKPFVEVGFMPEALASGKQTCFHYKGNVTMPAVDAEWQDLITKFTEHIIDRYGKEEVERWFFEVWNEPNLNFFFDGTMEDYFHLYELTAKALKAVDDGLRVGGPATSNNMWIPEFRSFCETNQVPLDFITTHHYPSDDPLSRAGMNGAGTKGHGMDPEKIQAIIKEKGPQAVQQMMEEMFSSGNNNPRDVLYQTAKKVKEEAGDYPVYYTEWNAGHFDVSYAAAGVTQTLAYNEGLVEGYSYWCVSDIFEEMGLHGLPYNNEFGLVNVYGIPKPVYRLFEQLHAAGNKRLTVLGEAHRTVELLVLADDTTVTIFAYNHDIEEREITAEDVEITLDGTIRKIEKAVIDSSHCNPFAKWEQQGKPVYPTKEQLAELEKESELVFQTQDTANTLTLTLEPESVAIYRITK